ncbi:hypothetical protein C7974DRAFT_391416 [Boeremia exigua]|uniref:uncharacterized protein n=1 Tax=Boeremia exigua TaxID=749465 RepID=UPI001E8E1EFC|nr:uncharacterized protein C7974DRAFT_391416 [Boeremia exigua]KAH6638359.1 hypothetical protein C7974DRAFT_391416 [Boeremia exigua]
MFKAQVLRRSFSVFNRVPTSRIVQSAARDGHESITIHRVRIQKPFLSKQRLVGAVAIATATYGLGQYLGLEVEIEEREVEDKKPGRWKKQVRKEDGTLEEVDDEEANEIGEAEEEDEEDEDEEEYDEAVLFFPTGLSRRKPTTLYKGSDPEWQEFKKVSQDKARVERIRQNLVDLVRTAFSAPAYAAKIGEVDHKKGRVWIEFKFPPGPPPEYERPGYELTEDLEWRKTTRDVEPVHHHRLHKLLRPSAAAGALYEDTKRKAERTWNDIAVYIGWAEKTEHLTQMTQQVATPSPSTGSAASSATAATASPFGPSLPAATQQPTSPSSSSAAGSEKEVSFALPDPKALTLDLGQFRQDFQKANRIVVQNVPRGAFGVHALVEVHGSKARLTLNVVGVYDPKISQYVGFSIHVWNMTPHRQWPGGGS